MDKRYQVFVSSTYTDLKDERSEIFQTLMEMDCIPAGMELFPAADEEQFKFIKRIIDDCDYYILIIGGRYGSTTADGISFTEKEYDYAREKGLKILSFIHNKPEDIPVGKSDTDKDLRAKLEAFREKVQHGTLVKFWSDAKELPGLVSLSLNKTIKTYPAVGWVRADKLASSEALNELNEVRKQNKELQEHVKELEHSLQAMDSTPGNLAGLEDYTVVTGKISANSNVYNANITLTWGELFAAIAPHILGEPADRRMQHLFIEEMGALYLAKNKVRGVWSGTDQDFQTSKIQFKTLNLIELSMRGTVSEGMALFWSLTPAGERVLMDLRSAKKDVDQNVKKTGPS
jgi:hypothetical protein